MGRPRIKHRFDGKGTELKRCSSCHEWLPLENFNPLKITSDKLQSKCKICHSQDGCKWQKENAEYRRVYMNNKYATDPEYRNKHKIRTLTNAAIRDGRLIKPDECSLCHIEGPVQAHHVNYTEWDILNPVFVCAACHAQIHSELTKKEENE